MRHAVVGLLLLLLLVAACKGTSGRIEPTTRSDEDWYYELGPHDEHCLLVRYDRGIGLACDQINWPK